MSSPHPQGLGAQRAMAGALARAGLAADAIGYLSLFGLAFFLLMELLERLTIPWHVSRRDYIATPANEATL